MANGPADIINMPSVSGTAQFHQTLHGYRSGHELLGTSLEMSSTARRLMLSLSDLSGSSSGLKFESYLTGYPIADIGAYAFARTWYAGEMRRPGCVWTHTLLIPFDALDYIGEFQGLVSLFHRPPEDWDYTAALHLSAEQLRDLTDVEHSAVTAPHKIVEDIILSLYSSPDTPTVLPAPNFYEYEPLVLALVSQQWPRIQRNFTFCTGTFSPRSLNNRAFDLQVIPLNAVLKFQREVPAANVVAIQRSDVSSSETSSVWQKLACADLLEPDYFNLRRFCNTFGVDTPPDRQAFASLVDSFAAVYKYRENTGNLEEIIDVVADRFPSPREALTLKKALFGKEMEVYNLIGVSSAELLVSVGSCAGSVAYNADDLQLKERTHDIASGDPKLTYELIVRLVHQHLNFLGEYILSSVFEVMGIDDLLNVVWSRPSLLPMFMAHYPELAMSEKIWQSSLDQQQQLVDVLLKKKDVDWQRIIPTILQSRAKGIEYDLITGLGFTVYDVILNWVDKLLGSDHDSINLITHEWRQLLSRSPEHLVRWLSESDAPQLYTLAFAIKLLHPRLPVIAGIISNTLVDFAVEAKDSLQGNERSDVMAFLLSLSLDSSDHVAPELAAIAFQHVHKAAAEETLSYQTWRWFEGQVPLLDWWKDWDKCEKLGRGLVNAFIRHNWPLKYFTLALPQEDMFTSCIDYCGSFYDGRRLGANLSIMVRSESITAPDFVPRILNEKKRRKQFK